MVYISALRCRCCNCSAPMGMPSMAFFCKVSWPPWRQDKTQTTDKRDRQTNEHTDRQAGRQTDGKAERWIDVRTVHPERLDCDTCYGTILKEQSAQRDRVWICLSPDHSVIHRYALTVAHVMRYPLPSATSFVMWKWSQTYFLRYVWKQPEKQSATSTR